MCTQKGVIKKTSLEAYSRPRSNGINAITVRDGDQLLERKLTNGTDEIMMAIKSGRAIRFNETKVRAMGRNRSGVRGIKMDDSDEVVGMITVREAKEETVLVVSEKGYGKRSFLNDPEDDSEIYRVTNRGGKGVKTLNVTEKTGNLIAIKNVTDENDLMIINRSGVIIRMAVSDLRVMGRATQGVKLINLKKEDEIAAVAKVDVEEEEEMEGLEGEEGMTSEENSDSNESPSNDENSETEGE